MKVSLVKEGEINIQKLPEPKSSLAFHKKERSHKTMERDLLKALSFML